MSNDTIWEKYASSASKPNKNKRLSIPLTPELETAISAFKQYHPDVKTDAAVAKTMLEAGFKQWAAYIRDLRTQEDQ